MHHGDRLPAFTLQHFFKLQLVLIIVCGIIEPVIQGEAQIKQVTDSLEQYSKGGREDLAKKEEQEIAWIKAYLPQAMTPADLEQAVRDAMAESGAQGPKDMGKVMKALMPKVKGRADGAVVSDTVKRLLNPPAAG